MGMLALSAKKVITWRIANAFSAILRWIIVPSVILLLIVLCARSNLRLVKMGHVLAKEVKKELLIMQPLIPAFAKKIIICLMVTVKFAMKLFLTVENAKEVIQLVKM